jgi:hypothetical protein
MVVHDLRAVNDSQVEKSEWPDCVRHSMSFHPYGHELDVKTIQTLSLDMFRAITTRCGYWLVRTATQKSIARDMYPSRLRRYFWSRSTSNDPIGQLQIVP